MNAAGRIAIYGAGLVVAFGGAYALASVVVPPSVVAAWQEEAMGDGHNAEGGDGMSNADDHNDDGAMAGHDHAPDGGPAPDGIAAAADPTFPVGSKVRLTADHMPGMEGAEATISGAFDTTTYSVTYTPTNGGDPVVDHRWVVHEELENPGDAPLADGTEVVLTADHMPGMNGADASIFSSTSETVYMVDLEVDGMKMTNHKWVVESEIQPLP
ncbi:YdhK family protein [Microbacterium sp. NPDC089987]|uniref:YdhK family protein n=1 Tax=Microbacterium sp. NPDC089987 TaxID=3364202 RepID=UPI0038096485